MRALPKNTSAAYAALLVLALLWGYNWVVMKIAVHDASPFVFGAWRTLGGAAALVLGALITRKRLPVAHLRIYAIIGVFQTGGFIALVTWAIVSAGAGRVAMLSYTMPLWVALIAWPVLGERLRLLQGAAVAIAFAGVACMIGPLSHGALPSLMALAAGASWAVGVILTKRVQRNGVIDIYTLTTWQMLAGGIVLLAVAIAVPGRPTAWTVSFTLAVAYNIFFATALAYVLWTFVLARLPARTASMGTLMNPLVGVLAGWIQLGEVPSKLEAAGMVLVVAGLAVLAFADRSPVTASAPRAAANFRRRTG